MILVVLAASKTSADRDSQRTFPVWASATAQARHARKGGPERESRGRRSGRVEAGLVSSSSSSLPPNCSRRSHVFSPPLRKGGPGGVAWNGDNAVPTDWSSVIAFVTSQIESMQ